MYVCYLIFLLACLVLMIAAMEGVIENGVNRAVDSVKLFVGQLPKQMSEQQLVEIFSEAGTVNEINIIKDKLTKLSRGE